MVNVKSKMEILEDSIDCFYPFTSCTSDWNKPPSGRPPRSKKKKAKNSSTKKSSAKKTERESREDRDSSRHSRDRSRSKSRDRYLMKEAEEKRILKKRIGAAYIRSADSIATRETALVSAHNREELTEVDVNQSEDTYTTGSVSKSSSDDFSSDSDINTSSDEVSESITARLRNINRIQDARSITTEDVESKPVGPFSWFQAKVNLSNTESNIEGPTSSGDSTNAVKKTVSKTIRGKFDYIRKNQRFANPFPDPPSDQSMATSHSIRAEDAGSLLFRGRRTQTKEISQLAKANEMIARRNELVKQIMKQRNTAYIPRPGFDP